MRYWLVCYDIADDKQRRRVYKCLLKYGEPVQRSVFELCFPERNAHMKDALVQELTTLVEGEAKIHFYALGKESVQKSWALDNSTLFKRNGATIV